MRIARVAGADAGRRPSLRDAVLPAGIAAVATVEAVAFGPPDLLAVLVLQWLSCAALVARRPLPTLAATSALGLTLLPTTVLGPEVDELASPIAVIALSTFTLGRHAPVRRGVLALLGCTALVLGVLGNDEPQFDVTDVVFVVALFTPPFVFGLVLRELAARNAQLTAQAAELLRLQAQVRQDAVSAERSRIARELHDVIAHSLSAMVVQASAAEDLTRTDPARAAGVMRDVAATGRRAMAETGRLLHLIRDTDDELGLAPDAGLDRLDALVERFRRSGLDVRLQVDGSLEALPAGVDLSAYRIVQEALTNALKHAADGVARVRVRRSGDALHIDAENRGSAESGGQGSGLGLVGMAERVHVFGGRLDHGFTDDERFVLSARLPLGEPG